MKAKPGFRFIITFTLPSGLKLAMGEHQGSMALIPIDESGYLRKVLAWPSMDEVMKFLKDFEKTNGKEAIAKLKSLKMDIGQVKIAQ